MLFALSLPASAQQPTNVPRLGYLSALNPATDSTRPEAIRLSMSERGYLEGNFGSSIIFDFELPAAAAQASCRGGCYRADAERRRLAML